MDQNKNICLSNLCYIVTSTEKVKFITFTWWHFWKTFLFARFTCSKLEEFLQGSFSQICQVKCSFGYTAQYIQVDCLGS